MESNGVHEAVHRLFRWRLAASRRQRPIGVVVECPRVLERYVMLCACEILLSGSRRPRTRPSQAREPDCSQTRSPADAGLSRLALDRPRRLTVRLTRARRLFAGWQLPTNELSPAPLGRRALGQP